MTDYPTALKPRREHLVWLAVAAATLALLALLIPSQAE
jgi:heme exporter protein D